ncbi:P-glycoprotein-9 [Aphelenchoides besseyi]|nr:P-glycoprotein-9 [Aphelenchoides besseyi]
MATNNEKSKVPLLNKFRKKNDNETKVKPRSVSIFQLWRFASKTDVCLVVIGSLVAVWTGISMPFLAIIIGGMSEAFVNATIATEFYWVPVEVEGKWMFLGDIYKLEDFQAAAMYRVWQSIIIGVLMFLAASTQVFCSMTACESMMSRLRKEFFKAMLRQDVAYFDTKITGSMATKLFDDLERIREGTGDKVALAIQFSAQFLGGFAVAFTYDYKLTLIMMSLSPLLMCCGWFISRLMAKSATIEAEKYSVAGSKAEEALSALRTVYSFNAQEVECKRYEELLESAKRDGYIRAVYVGAGLCATFLVMFGSYAMSFYIGTNYVVDGLITPQIMITVFFSVMIGSMSLGQAAPQFAVIGTAMGTAASIYEVIDRKPEIDSYSTEGLKPELSGRIRFQNVKFEYPSRPDVTVLNDISFEIEPNQTVAFVGSSGCGKSTICNLLLRYYNKTGGEILLDNTPIEQLNIAHLRKSIATVNQEPSLFNCDIKENIMYGAPEDDVSDDQIRQACEKANAGFISSLPKGLNTIAGERGVQLSGGQKQRIAIARALVRSPKILLLDESTSALDAESEAVVQQALYSAAKATTTIVIAHRLSTIKNVDRIFCVDNGKIVEYGTHDELLELHGHYEKLITSQVFVDLEDNVEEEIAVAPVQANTRSRKSQSVKSTSSSGADSPRKSLFRNSVADSSAEPTKNPVSEKKRLIQECEAENVKPSNLLQILKFSRPEWFYLASGVLICIVEGCIFPIFSISFSNILEVFAGTDPVEKRKQGHNWAMVFLLLGIVHGSAMFLHAILFGVSSERLTMRLRTALYRHFFSQNIGYFDASVHSTGRLCTRLASDAPNVKAAIDYRLGSVFAAVVSIVFGVVLAFYYNYKMAILVVLIFPLGSVGHYFHARFFRGRSKEDANELEEVGRTALEAIDQVRTVKNLTLEERFYKRFAEHLEKPYQTYRIRARYQALSYGFASSIFYFLHATAFAFGVYLIIEYNEKPMSVMRTLFAVSFCAGSIGFASSYFPEYTKARFAAGLIFKMLNEKPEFDNASKYGRQLTSVDGRIKLTDVDFHYPERANVKILKKMNLSIESGKTLAIVGPSGCGKSTIISLIERFYDPNYGTVEIDGVNLKEMSPQEIRSHIALVSQEPVLMDRTIRENILYGLDPNSVTEEQLREVCEKANLSTLIEELPDKLETRVGSSGTMLSGGQKQRVAIARALIRNPRILLLDEATSALDAESEKLVQEALERAAVGRTVVVVAHRLSTIVNANCIAVMKNGVLAELGTHSQLVAARGFYWELTEKQNIRKT